jgi:hypothetical protein
VMKRANKTWLKLSSLIGRYQYQNQHFFTANIDTNQAFLYIYR